MNPQDIEKTALENRCKAIWESDAAIRAEFGQFETYLAFAQANSDGRLKVLGQGKQHV